MKKIIIAFKMAVKNIYSNKSRTFFSLLGITIGIASVVAVMSLGLGFKQYVLGQIESFGTDTIEVEIKVPNTNKTSSQNASGIVGGTQITTLKLDDFEEIAKIKSLGNWYGGIISQKNISYQDKNKQTMIWGVTAGVAEIDGQFEITQGRMYDAEDDKNLKQCVVLGSGIKKDFFGDKNPVGKNIKINKMSFQVIGVAKERGSTGFFDFDNLIFIPLETLQKKVMGIDYVQFGMFKIKDKKETTLAVLQIEDIMRNRHNINDSDDDDFAVTAMTEAMEMLDSVFRVINILLISLASISLIVGGVGITNVMYVAVSERVSEIGLRKALGAKKKSILFQFLFEAIFITMIGGIFGMILAFVMTKAASFIIGKYGFQLSFPIDLNAIFLGIGFSVLVGIIFGVRPAQKASQLSPMEAIRRE